MKTLIVDKKNDNQKLTKYLLNIFPALKFSTIQKALRQKDIIINNIRINKDTIVHYNDKITIYIDDNFFCFNVLNYIVYEDDNIIIINKPVEIEVTGPNSLHTELQQQVSPSIEPCHRLDRNTTGLVLFAKNQLALDILLDAFKNKKIDKYYACIVYGIPKKKSDTLKSYHFKDAKNSYVIISDIQKENYKEIITHYKIIKTNLEQNISLLEVKLETGRTHQIRAHLAHINSPIIGDEKYGNIGINKKFKYKYQLLCSYKMTFNLNNTFLDYLNDKNFEIPYKFKLL